MASLLGSPTGDAIDAIRRFTLSPLLSGPLFLLASRAPDQLQGILNSLVDRLAAVGLPTAQVPTERTLYLALRLLFGFSLLRFFNKKLNAIAANGWRLSTPGSWDWKNEIAVVTGGSGGIGRFITEKLIARGVKVAILDLAELPPSLQGDSRVKFYKCDITSFESVAKAAEAIREDLGHPSILVNNAGISNPDAVPILEDTERFVNKAFSVNCVGLWATTQQFLPEMVRRNKGHVVTLASIGSFITFPAGVAYSASKAAALAFHEGLTCELKHLYRAPEVMTTVVHPNFVRTPLLGNMIEGLDRAGVNLLEPQTVAEAIVKQILSKSGAQIFVPPPASALSGLRGWSTWLQEVVRDGSGKLAAQGQELERLKKSGGS